MKLCSLALLLSASACTSAAPASAPDDGGIEAMVDAPLDAPEAETAPPLVVTATTRPIPGNTIGVIVDVATAAGATISVDGAGIGTPKALAGADGKASLAVLGLHPKTTEHVHVRAEKDGRSAETTVSFDAGALPFDLPDAFAPTVTSPGLDGYVLVGAGRMMPKIDVNLVLDRAGRIVWYWAPEMYSLFGNFVRMGDDFVVSDESVKGFRRVDPFGATSAIFRAAGSGDSYDSHELLDVGSGHVMLIGFDPHTYDSRPYFTDGVADATRFDNTFDEVDAAGKVYSHFSTFGTIDPAEMVEDGSKLTTLDPKATDITHANSIDVGPDGDALFSLRHVSSVLKVSRKDGKVSWRLGGKKSDFTFVDDPLGGFDHQHDARWVPGKSEIWVYDNGNDHVPKVTRAVRYAIDESAKTATLLWSFVADAPHFSAFAGSVRTLPNGHLMIAYAQQGTILEIDPTTKTIVWQLSIAPLLLYRGIFDPAFRH